MASTFLGLIVVLAALFCILGATLLGYFPVLLTFRWHIVGAFALFSCVLAVAWLRAVRAARESFGDTRPSAPGVLARNWSILMAVLAAISIFLQPMRPFSMIKAAPVAAAPRPLPPPPAPILSAPPAPSAPVTFRQLKIQGILYQPKKPLVIIDGDSYAPGDRIYDLRIKCIERNKVIVEKDGVEKVIAFN